MDPLTRRIIAALFGYTSGRRAPYHAKIKSISRGIATLDNGVKVVATKAMKPRASVVVVPTEINPLPIVQEGHDE